MEKDLILKKINERIELLPNVYQNYVLGELLRIYNYINEKLDLLILKRK